MISACALPPTEARALLRRKKLNNAIPTVLNTPALFSMVLFPLALSMLVVEQPAGYPDIQMHAGEGSAPNTRWGHFI
jgi:hypothetical protein